MRNCRTCVNRVMPLLAFALSSTFSAIPSLLTEFFFCNRIALDLNFDFGGFLSVCFSLFLVLHVFSPISLWLHLLSHAVACLQPIGKPPNADDLKRAPVLV